MPCVNNSGNSKVAATLSVELTCRVVINWAGDPLDYSLDYPNTFGPEAVRIRE